MKNFRLIVVLVIMIGLWEVSRRLFTVSPLVMPGIVDIVVSLARSVWSGEILRQLGFSFAIIGVSTGIAFVLALGAMLASATSTVTREAIGALSSLLHPLPGIALLPVVILWFGTGRIAIAVIIVHSVFWPLLTNLLAGYQSVPTTYRLVSRNLGLSTFEFTFRIAVPATVPYLVAGLRIAWARSWRALISAEMVFGAVAGRGGIGWYLHTQRVFMDTTGLFAGILVVMVIGSLVERGALGYLERVTVHRWGTSQ